MSNDKVLKRLRRFRTGVIEQCCELDRLIYDLETRVPAVAKGRRGYTRSKEVAGVKAATSRSPKAAK